MAEIKVEGLAELRKGLKDLDAKFPKELNKVAKASAEVVATEARQIVPRRSGALQSSIKASGLAKGGVVKSGGLAYHRVIHFGWPRHNIKPNPFLYHALDNRHDEVVEKFEREVQALVNKVV
jgi:HK97 gp10 family phage protein